MRSSHGTGQKLEEQRPEVIANGPEVRFDLSFNLEIRGDCDSLVQALRDLGLPGADIAALQEAISSDGKSSDSVRTWIKKTAPKLVGIAGPTAVKVLWEVIRRHMSGT